MILTGAVKYATLLSLGSMRGLNDFHCPLQTAPNDMVYILSAYGRTIHLQLLHLNHPCDYCCVWCASYKYVYSVGSCLGRFCASFVLTVSIECFSFWLLLSVYLCADTLDQGEKSSEKISSTPLPLFHFSILCRTPTEVIRRLECFFVSLVVWDKVTCSWWDDLYYTGRP